MSSIISGRSSRKISFTVFVGSLGPQILWNRNEDSCSPFFTILVCIFEKVTSQNSVRNWDFLRWDDETILGFSEFLKFPLASIGFMALFWIIHPRDFLYSFLVGGLIFPRDFWEFLGFMGCFFGYFGFLLDLWNFGIF